VSLEAIHEQLLDRPRAADEEERREFTELPRPRPPRLTATRPGDD
jgi:hypothetical protein